MTWLSFEEEPTSIYDKIFFVSLLAVFGLSFYFSPIYYYKMDMRFFSFLPDMSLSKTVGVCGPTCGLTRSFVNISHGRFFDGFLANFMGPFVYISFFGFFLYFGYRFFGGKKRLKLALSVLSKRILLFSVIGAFIISWIVKLLSPLKTS